MTTTRISRTCAPWMLLAGLAAASPPTETVKLDPDELPENAARLTQIERQAHDLKGRLDALDARRRPLALVRDPILYQYNANVAAMQTLERQMRKALADIPKTERRLTVMQGTPAAGRVEAQLNNLKAVAVQSRARGEFLFAANREVEPQLAALNTQIAPLDQAIAADRMQLDQLRVDWLNIRVPEKKYARADYEQLFRVCHDWVRLDGSWPDAYLWRALARFELGEREEALEDVARALELWDSFHKDDLKTKRSWPGGNAARGFLLATSRKNRKTSDASFTKARLSPAGKKSAEVQYLAGRAQALLGDDKRAAAFYRAALKLDDAYLPAMHHLAHLLATTQAPDVKDGYEAVQLAEQVARRTGRRSWRVVETLAYAYLASGQRPKAAAVAEELEQLLPTEERPRLTALRDLLEDRQARR